MCGGREEVGVGMTWRVNRVRERGKTVGGERKKEFLECASNLMISKPSARLGSPVPKLVSQATMGPARALQTPVGIVTREHSAHACDGTCGTPSQRESGTLARPCQALEPPTVDHQTLSTL